LLKLNDVTLVCVTSVKIEQNVKSLIKSMEGIEYGDVKFISDIYPENLPENVKYVRCDKQGRLQAF
jgi:RNA binding exosome subunit